MSRIYVVLFVLLEVIFASRAMASYDAPNDPYTAYCLGDKCYYPNGQEVSNKE